jgi:nitrogen-specific signal transduction histidine kinase
VRLQLRKKERDIPDVVVKVFDTLPTVAVLVDWDGVVLFANKALKSVLERDREVLWHAPYSKVWTVHVLNLVHFRVVLTPHYSTTPLY